MSALRGTIHLHADQRPAEVHLSPTADRWCLDVGGDAGGVLPDLTIFGSADQMRSLAHMILAALPDEGERCGICGGELDSDAPSDLVIDVEVGASHAEHYGDEPAGTYDGSVAR